MYWISFTIGAVLGFWLFSWLFRISVFRRVSPDWKRELYCVLTVLIVGGLVAGFGEGEGGFQNRVTSMLSLNGITSRVPAAIIYYLLFLFYRAATPARVTPNNDSEGT